MRLFLNHFLAHLAPGTKFDFQKYIKIKRSLEDDFKVVVGIRMAHIVLCCCGSITAIISRCAFEIKERHVVVQGIPLPLVQLTDQHFWFGNPGLVLFLILFTLFQVTISSSMLRAFGIMQRNSWRVRRRGSMIVILLQLLAGLALLGNFQQVKNTTLRICCSCV